jgi:hypothetical protein
LWFGVRPGKGDAREAAAAAAVGIPAQTSLAIDVTVTAGPDLQCCETGEAVRTSTSFKWLLFLHDVFFLSQSSKSAQYPPVCISFIYKHGRLALAYVYFWRRARAYVIERQKVKVEQA